MKQRLSQLSPRAALLIGAAFLSTPVIAQEATPQALTPPPPVQIAPEAPAPVPEVRIAPASPVVQPLPPAEEQAAESAEQAPAATATAARASRPARSAQTAPRATPREAAPTVTTAASPAPQQPLPTAETPVQPATETAPETVTTTTTTQQATVTTSIAPWILGGLAVVVAVAAAMMLLRRRRPEEDAVVGETVTTIDPATHRPAQPIVPRVILERAPVATAPVAAAAPVAAPHAEANLGRADAAVLEHVVDAAAPVANRPWLELGLRAVRAGTSEDEALVDIELTIGNSGDVPARDVRVSTFLLADAEPAEMERLLTGRGSGGDVLPVTIAPGDGARVDAHLAVVKGDLGRTFNPVVIAEARYRLPDGREGRTSGAFRIGRPAPAAEGVGPIGATRPHLVEDVEAELIGTPAHA